MKKVFSIAKAFINLPQAIRLEVMYYYINRIFLKAPTSHQVIWTSFLYFASEPNFQVTIQEDGDSYIVNFCQEGEDYKTLLRRGSSTDIFVFFQVFIVKGYHPLLLLLEEKLIHPKVIIDAGANVGFFSYLMLKKANPHLLVAIEPEPSNYNQMKKNLTAIGSSHNVNFLQAALWINRTYLSIDNTDGGEWATKVREGESDHICSALSLNDILADFYIDQIDVLKIDVEGAEAVLFSDNRFISCLTKVKIIAIEIHDRLADRNHINSVLTKSGFFLKEIGELTLGWREN